MPNQSGKIVLILVFLFLLFGAAVYFFLPTFTKQKFNEQIPANDNLLEDKKNDTVKCKTDLGDTEDDAGIWEFLPNYTKEITYKKGKVSPGEATYQIYLLKQSIDCKYLAFLLELEARGDGAYSDEDYKNRGVYIFDSEQKKITTVLLIPKELSFDKQEYGSNLWISDSQYQFVLSESVKQGEFVKRRYLYDISDKTLIKSQVEI